MDAVRCPTSTGSARQATSLLPAPPEQHLVAWRRSLGRIREQRERTHEVRLANAIAFAATSSIAPNTEVRTAVDHRLPARVHIRASRLARRPRGATGRDLRRGRPSRLGRGGVRGGRPLLGRIAATPRLGLRAEASAGAGGVGAGCLQDGPPLAAVCSTLQGSCSGLSGRGGRWWRWQRRGDGWGDRRVRSARAAVDRRAHARRATRSGVLPACGWRGRGRFRRPSRSACESCGRRG
jgi:hypothetical protein